MLPATVILIGQPLRRTLVRQLFYSAKKAISTFVCCIISIALLSQKNGVNQYNVVWKNQSNNAAASMPCGGGNIGTNVWVENGSLYIYMQQSGWFDENNTALKAGRIKINFTPNPFTSNNFSQTLQLEYGSIVIQTGEENKSTKIHIWVDVFQPIIHIQTQSKQAIHAIAAYESWRYKDRLQTGKANNANSWKWAKHVQVIAPKDSIYFYKNSVAFFHQNKDSSVFDYAVKQQGLEKYKDSLFNPLHKAIYGGIMHGYNMIASKTYNSKYADTDCVGWQLESKQPSKQHHISVYLSPEFTKDFHFVQQQITKNQQPSIAQQQYLKTKAWWQHFWKKSFIHLYHSTDSLNAQLFSISKNYHLFRYMLGCNVSGTYPTKFNGGLFTVDPVFTDTSIHSTPDHRNWGGGTFTAQNQRLVYWPLLKTGDIDLMFSQFNFYQKLLKNAEIRSKVYWQHEGACFTEQIENFGLPNPAEYGYKRPANSDKGVEFNKWLEYEWDTVLEFCYMILEAEKYYNININKYIPLIKSCLSFFDNHYQYQSYKNKQASLDSNGKLILYPGSAAETFKLTTNASSTIAALRTVTKSLLQSAYLPLKDKLYFQSLFNKIPPIPLNNFNGKTTIAPAEKWERVTNTETPQLYPVFPYNIFGIGKPNLETAVNTYLYDTFAVKFRSHIGWKQDNIFAAKLGLTNEAARLTSLKLADSKSNLFPAFWGPGFDWTPDHNHGGSGMIGLQEMLLQTNDNQILLFPAWPKDWNVYFKLHAPNKTTVEATLINGKLEQLIVLPKERVKDVINMLTN